MDPNEGVLRTFQYRSYKLQIKTQKLNKAYYRPCSSILGTICGSLKSPLKAPKEHLQAMPACGGAAAPGPWKTAGKALGPAPRFRKSAPLNGVWGRALKEIWGGLALLHIVYV